MHKIHAMAQSPDLVASADVCDTLYIDRSTLSRWVKDGTAVPTMRLPGARGAFLFSAEEVERLKPIADARRRGDVA